MFSLGNGEVSYVEIKSKRDIKIERKNKILVI